jgi:hypothetical protein
VHFIDQLRLLPLSFWIALGITVGLTLLLVLSRIADAEERARSDRTAGMLRRKKRSSAPSGSEPKILISDEGAVNPGVTGRLLDCSVTTVSLRAANSLDRGTIVSWRPADAPANFGWAVVEVKDARQDGRHWKLACRFVRTPPWVTRFLDKTPAEPKEPAPAKSV